MTRTDTDGAFMEFQKSFEAKPKSTDLGRPSTQAVGAIKTKQKDEAQSMGRINSENRA